MILTCDNGIAAIDQIAEAKKLGMTVVVTDHHDIQADEVSGEEIVPPADAIVNPKEKTVNIRLVRSAALWWHID